MANTFLQAQGIKVGKSLCEKDLGETALEILDKAKAAKCEVLLPVDVVVAGEFKANAPHQVVDATACPDDQMILDVGPKSIALYAGAVDECATLVWNGPLGAFEMKPFDTGTVALARDRRRPHQREASCCRWRAAATPWRRWPRPASRTSSPTSRRRAAPSWNGWKARPCPALRRSYGRRRTSVRR